MGRLLEWVRLVADRLIGLVHRVAQEKNSTGAALFVRLISDQKRDISVAHISMIVTNT